MSSIDLVILGIVLEKPQSAYDIQKDVEYHHFPCLLYTSPSPRDA